MKVAIKFCSLAKLTRYRNLPVKQKITVKSTPKGNQKTSGSITLPLALP